MQARIFGTALLLATMSAAAAQAEDEGGQALVGKPAPPLKFAVYNSHNRVDLADLRGRTVVIDFFQCENSKDTSGFDDLADVEHANAGKGVVVLGVSADMNPSAITALLRKKPNIDWPIDYDPNGFSGPTCEEWKESHKVGDNTFMSYFHLDYIVDPEGVVVWSGMPDQVGRALDQQFKDHPPAAADASAVADSTASLVKMEAAIKSGDLAAAVKARHSIAATALGDDDFANKVKKADASLTDAGNAAIKTVDELIEKKQFPEAAAKLKSLQSIDDGSPLAASVKSRLAALQRSPEAKAALMSNADKAKADDLLKSAESLRSRKMIQQAYARYRQVTTSYPGSPQAADASAAIKEIEAARPTSTPSVSKIPGDVDHARAKGLLNVADSYRDNGNYEKAREKYEAVVTQFPNSGEAKTAQTEIAKLPK